MPYKKTKITITPKPPGKVFNPETQFKETSNENEVVLVNGPLSGYILRPIGDEYLKKKKVPEDALRFGLFKPNATKPYVMMIKDGVVSCGCPAWTRNKERTCKHTKAISSYLMNVVGITLSTLNIEFEDSDALLDSLM